MKKKSTDKDNINKFYAGLFIFFFLVFSLIAFIKAGSNTEVETETYNGFDFVKSNGFWTTEIRNPIINKEYVVEFRYSPNEVKEIPVEGDPKNFFHLLGINDLDSAYFTFNPGQNLSDVNLLAADIAKYLRIINGIHIVAACTSDEDVSCKTRPIVTCENKEDSALVIYATKDDVAKVSMDKNCLTIQGKDEELLKAYTKLLFVWYGII